MDRWHEARSPRAAVIFTRPGTVITSHYRLREILSAFRVRPWKRAWPCIAAIFSFGLIKMTSRLRRRRDAPDGTMGVPEIDVRG